MTNRTPPHPTPATSPDDDGGSRETRILAWLLNDGGDAPDVTLSRRVATEWIEIGYDVQPLVAAPFIRTTDHPTTSKERAP